MHKKENNNQFNNYNNNPAKNYQAAISVLSEAYSRNMMSAPQYSPVSTVPCSTTMMPQYVQNQYIEPALLQSLIDYNLNTMSMMTPVMNPNMSNRSSLSPPRSLSQTPLLSPTPTPTYFDIYGNQMVPVFFSSNNVAQMNPNVPMTYQTIPFNMNQNMSSRSSLSPPRTLSHAPMLSPGYGFYPSPSSTQSISPEMFVPTEAFNIEARSRRNSLSSCASLNESSPPIAPVVENKKELVPRVLKELEQAFTQRFTQSGLRGKDIFRVKCKTKPSLKNILELLQTMDHYLPLKEVSCPASTKKGKRQKRGFLCYVKVDLEHMPLAESIFREFNAARGMPFNAIEVDPQRKTPKVQI